MAFSYINHNPYDDDDVRHAYTQNLTIEMIIIIISPIYV